MPKMANLHITEKDARYDRGRALLLRYFLDDVAPLYHKSSESYILVLQ